MQETASVEMLVFGGAKGWFGGNFGFRRCRKQLRWRCWFSAARRAVRMRIWFPTAWAWGALLPYTPSGDGVREGCDPLALSRGWFGGNLDFRRCRKRLRWRCWLSTARRAVRVRIWFPTARAWGAPLPYTPSGDGVREGCDPLALSRGAGGNLDFRRCKGVFLVEGLFFRRNGSGFRRVRKRVSGAFGRGGGRAFWTLSEFFIGLRRMDSCANGF